MKKKTLKKLLVGLVAVFVVLGTVSSAVAFNDDATSLALRSLANYLDKNPDSEVARTLAKTVLTLSQKSVEELGTNLNLTRAQETTLWNEIGVINKDTVISTAMVDGVAVLGMPIPGDTTTTTINFTNKTGGPIYIDLTKTYVQFYGTVSSSVSIAMGTSTLAGIANYTSTVPSNLINRTTLATSTIGFNEYGLVAPTTSKRLALLKNNESVITGWNQTFSPDCIGTNCEAVTSSNRGYYATTTIFYTRLVDPNRL